MNILAKTATVLLATAALGGFASLGSTAFADTPAAAATTAENQLGSTQGFHITNMSGDPADPDVEVQVTTAVVGLVKVTWTPAARSWSSALAMTRPGRRRM